MIELLEKYNPSAAPPSTSTLETVFSELEAIRIPRSSALVKAARAQGESRVVNGAEECKARNDVVRDLFRDPNVILASMKNFIRGGVPSINLHSSAK